MTGHAAASQHCTGREERGLFADQGPLVPTRRCRPRPLCALAPRASSPPPPKTAQRKVCLSAQSCRLASLEQLDPGRSSQAAPPSLNSCLDLREHASTLPPPLLPPPSALDTPRSSTGHELPATPPRWPPGLRRPLQRPALARWSPAPARGDVRVADPSSPAAAWVFAVRPGPAFVAGTPPAALRPPRQPLVRVDAPDGQLVLARGRPRRRRGGEVGRRRAVPRRGDREQDTAQDRLWTGPVRPGPAAVSPVPLSPTPHARGRS